MRKHKIIVVLIAISSVLTFLVSYSFAQGREDAPLPKIGDVIGRLDEATGWMKSPEGQWIDRENRIPAYLSFNHLLLDYKELGTGIDNFIFLELRDIIIEGQEYYILIKPTRGGYYKYRSIHEGWTSKVHYHYFVFQKDELDNITIEKNAPKLIEINAENVSDEVSAFSVLNEEEMKQQISYEIKRRMDSSLKTTKLLLNIFYYGKDNVIRFLILSEEKYSFDECSSYGAIAAGGYLNDVPGGEESLIQPDVFDKFYYECPLEDFKKLIPLTIVE